MEPLLDEKGAAARLNTTERHVRQLRARREIPFVKVGGLVRFAAADLDEYVANRTIPAVRDAELQAFVERTRRESGVPARLEDLEPARENAATKARRYLVEGRLHILRVHGDRIFAECRGDGALWHPMYSRGSWRCDCPAGPRCAHLVALRLVTTEPKHRGDR